MQNPAVRNSSIGALQALYAVDDHVPSLSLFSARFSNRMVEMADDVDMTGCKRYWLAQVSDGLEASWRVDQHVN